MNDKDTFSFKLEEVGFVPETAKIRAKAGVILLKAGDLIDGFVFDEAVRLGDLSEDDLALRAKCRRDWTAPEFGEILRRAGIDLDCDLYCDFNFEETIDLACEKLGVSVFFEPADATGW